MMDSPHKMAGQPETQRDQLNTTQVAFPREELSSKVMRSSPDVNIATGMRESESPDS